MRGSCAFGRVANRFRHLPLRAIAVRSATLQFFLFNQLYDSAAFCLVIRARQPLAQKPQIFALDEPIHRDRSLGQTY